MSALMSLVGYYEGYMDCKNTSLAVSKFVLESCPLTPISVRDSQ